MKVKQKDDDFIFVLNGEIDLQNEEIIKKEIIDTLQKYTGFQNVFIDLKNVTFLGSSGLGMFVYINRFLNSRGKALHLLSPSTNVLKILELGAFDKLFKIEKQ